MEKSFWQWNFLCWWIRKSHAFIPLPKRKGVRSVSAKCPSACCFFRFHAIALSALNLWVAKTGFFQKIRFFCILQDIRDLKIADIPVLRFQCSGFSPDRILTPAAWTVRYFKKFHIPEIKVGNALWFLRKRLSTVNHEGFETPHGFSDKHFLKVCNIPVPLHYPVSGFCVVGFRKFCQ